VLTLVGQDVTAAAFSPDGTRIVTASSDKTARVWDAGIGRQLFRYRAARAGLVSGLFARRQADRNIGDQAEQRRQRPHLQSERRQAAQRAENVRRQSAIRAGLELLPRAGDMCS